MTADEERAAIIAYLRETANRLDALKDTPGEKTRSRYHAESCRFAAKYIEWRAHHEAEIPA